MEMGGCQEYIDALEEERRKIQVFQRELPLCLQLVTQAIEACRQQLAIEITGGRSDCEETSSEGPVLEEFIPLKRESEETQKGNYKEETKEDGCHETNDKDKKPDWLRSVQLWSQDAETSPKDQDVDSCRKSLSSETKKRGTFHPFCKEKKVPSASAPYPTPVPVVGPDPGTVAASSTTKGEGKEGSSQKKTRRCWSPELHHRFLHALQQLGGSHAATPKQIRELMKVDGLTNDEVKSHLQKYRLHTRRVPSTSIPMNNSQPAQFVVVGGIWVPPEYSAVASSGQAPEAGPATIYAPVATSAAPSAATTTSLQVATSKKPKKQSQQQSPDSGWDRSGGDKSGSREEQSIGEDASSSATSSSRTTTSPAL